VLALALLRRIAQFGPSGIQSFSYTEMLNSFLEGESAMYLDSTAIFGAVRSSPHSKIEGKVSYVLHPKGVHQASQSGGLGLAIARNAANPEAAFVLMQWLTSKAQDKAVTKLGGAPMRNSTMADADLVRQYPEFIVFKEALKHSNPDWRPIIPVWDRINVQALGVGISEALTGKKTAEAALNDLVAPVTQIMREAGYKV